MDDLRKGCEKIALNAICLRLYGQSMRPYPVLVAIRAIKRLIHCNVGRQSLQVDDVAM